MPRDRLIPIRNSQYEAIEKFIKDHPEQGYHSVSEVVRESLRQWFQKKKMEEKYFISESANDVELPDP